MPKTYPQRIFKCKQLSIVGLKVKCVPGRRFSNMPKVKCEPRLIS